MNSKSFRVLGLIFTAAGIASSQGALLTYDPFLTGVDPSQGQYQLGDLLAQNPTISGNFFIGGWTQNAGGATAGGSVTNESASYSDLRYRSPQGGSSLFVDNQAYARAFSQGWDGNTTNTYYMSFLASYGNSGGGQVGYRVFEIWNGGTGDGNRTLQMGYSQYGNFGASQNFSLNVAGVVSNTAIAADNNNSVNLYVLKFAMSNAQTNDVVSLWINPDLSNIASEPAPNIVISNVDFAADRLSGITRLGFAPGNAAVLDELRVGTVYADVVPPATLTAGTWTNQASGNWSVAANWTPNVVPNSPTSEALFGADAFGLPINNPSTVTLNIPVTLNRITFINVASPAAAYNIAGAQTLTLDNAAQISVGANTTVHTISAPIGNGASATAITKVGAGTVLLSGASTYAVPTTINGGILAVSSILDGGNPSPLGQTAADAGNLILNGGTLRYSGAGSTSDRLFALTSLGGSVDASGTGPINFNNAGGVVGFIDLTSHMLTLTGTNNGANTLAPVYSDAIGTSPSSLTKNGTGRWVLGGVESYTGGTLINSGVLALGAAASLNTTNITIQTNGTFDVSAPGAFTLLGGQVLQGFGKVQGPLNVSSGAIILPGASNVLGTLTVSNQFLPAGGEIALDLSPTNGGTSDFIIGDTLNFTSGGSLSVTPFPWGIWQTGVRTIMSYNALVSTPTTLTVVDKLGSRFNFGLSAAAGQVNLTISGGAGHNLVWTGSATTGAWDANSADLNWTDLSGPTPSKYFNPDNVTFDGTGIAFPAVNVIGILFPTSVAVNNASGNYILQGAGRISGTSTLTKTSAGTLTLANSGNNDYSGDTTVNGGRLTYGINNVLPFGAGKGNVSVGASGTLDISNLVANVNGLSGAGLVSGRPLSVLVAGNNNATGTFSGVISGNLTLIKTNIGTLTLLGANTYSNGTQIRGGLLVANTVSDSAGNSLGLGLDPRTGIQMQGSTLRYSGNTDATTGRGIANIFAVGATNFIDVSNNVTLTISGAMSQGAVGVVSNAFYKLGVGTLAMAGTLDNGSNSLVVQEGKALFAKDLNTAVSGFLLIRNGATAQLGGTNGNQINDTAVVQIDSGGTLDMNGRNEVLGGSAANGSTVNGLAGAGLILNSSNTTISTLTLNNLFVTTAVFTGRIQDGLTGGKISLAISNSITLAGSNAWSGDTIVRNGTFTLGSANSLPGGTGFGNLTVNSPGTLNVGGFNITANSLTGSGTINDATANRTNTVSAISPAATTNTFSGVLQNTPATTRLNLLKLGAGTMQLSGANSHSGNTTISNGVLALVGGGSIGNSLLIDVTGGTALDVNGATNPISTFNGNLILNSGQTLRGNGTVAGNILSGASSTIAPGASIGTLTVSGSITFAGTSLMELDRGAGQNSDRLSATAIQPFLLGPGSGSTLIVTNTGAALVAGDNFQLFVPNLLNQFKTTILPPLGPNLIWVNSLTTDGRIRVVSSANPGPTITINWGPGNFGFTLQVQTNGLQPNKWFPVNGSQQTNQMTFPIDPAVTSMFFRVIAP